MTDDRTADLPYDQRIARRLIPVLARMRVTPNQITWLTLALALLAGILFAQGEHSAACWAAGVFVLARFLDHFDGELARFTGSSSRLGYYLDYLAGGLSYAIMFLGIGYGLAFEADPGLGPLGLVLGIAGAAAALLSLGLNLDLDRTAGLGEGESVGYPGFRGFELEDGIYLLAPVTWLGWLAPFFVLAGIGAGIYTVWTAGRVIRARRIPPGAATHLEEKRYQP